MVCPGGRAFLLLQIYLYLMMMQLLITMGLSSTRPAAKFQLRTISKVTALHDRRRGELSHFLRGNKVVRSLTVQIRSHQLFMSPQDYDNQSRSSKQINFLLNKAVDLINRMTSKKRADDQKDTALETTVASREMSRIPVSLSFSATHKHPISLIDPAAALEYLSLPVDAYSVLDSNLVTRSPSSDDTFLLLLPLGDLSAASILARGGSTGIKLAATLSTEVTVQPDPSKGRVVMESGPIYFTPTASPKDSAVRPTVRKIESQPKDSDESTENTVEEVQSSFSDALPEWLLWGGRPASVDTRDDEHSTMINQHGDRVESNLVAPTTDEKSKSNLVKSSVQARFRIELQWKSFKLSELTGKESSGVQSILSRANVIRKSFSLFSKAGLDNNTSEFKLDNGSELNTDRISGASEGVDPSIKSNKSVPALSEYGDSSVQDTESSQAEKENDEVISLPVTAVVKVWVDVNLPVREDLSSALSFPPIKLLLNQAGALTTKALLRTIAPTLGKLLVKDHDNRRKIPTDLSSSNVDEVQKPFKKQENMYDDLTADIEIR
jgi:hypothetical protein